MSCTFLVPTVLALFWRRATREGALAALLTGFLTVAILWGLGVIFGIGKEGVAGPAGKRFAPMYLLGLDPLFHGLLLSAAAGLVASLLTQPQPAKHVNRYFLADEHSP